MFFVLRNEKKEYSRSSRNGPRVAPHERHGRRPKPPPAAAPSVVSPPRRRRDAPPGKARVAEAAAGLLLQGAGGPWLARAAPARGHRELCAGGLELLPSGGGGGSGALTPGSGGVRAGPVCSGGPGAVGWWPGLLRPIWSGAVRAWQAAWLGDTARGEVRGGGRGGGPGLRDTAAWPWWWPDLARYGVELGRGAAGRIRRVAAQWCRWWASSACFGRGCAGSRLERLLAARLASGDGADACGCEAAPALWLQESS